MKCWAVSKVNAIEAELAKRFLAVTPSCPSLRKYNEQEPPDNFFERRFAKRGSAGLLSFGFRWMLSKLKLSSLLIAALRV